MNDNVSTFLTYKFSRYFQVSSLQLTTATKHQDPNKGYLKKT